MKKHKAFTLIEILIAVSLTAILFILVFRSYVRITEIATRLEHEKKLSAELSYLTETVQNIADSYQIDYATYGSGLIQTNGWTNILYLTGNGTGQTSLLFSGDNIWRIKDATAIELIFTWSARISQWAFKVIPFTQTTTNAFLDIQHPWFWLIANMQTPKYNPQERIRDVDASVQQFYSLQRVE